MIPSHLLLVLRLLLLLLLGLLSLQFLLFLHKFSGSILVKVKVQAGPFGKVFVCFWNRMAVIFDLLNLVQVFFESFAGVGRVVPSLGLFDDRCYRLVLDHSANVDRIVHTAEYAALIRILHTHILEQLQPEGLQLVGIVLEQVEVVSYSRQDLVKVLLELSAVLLSFHDFRHTWRSWASRSGSTVSSCCVLDHLSLAGVLLITCRLDFDFLDQVVLLGIFLQFITHSADDILNLCLEELLE